MDRFDIKRLVKERMERILDDISNGKIKDLNKLKPIRKKVKRQDAKKIEVKAKQQTPPPVSLPYLAVSNRDIDMDSSSTSSTVTVALPIVPRRSRIRPPEMAVPESKPTLPPPLRKRIIMPSVSIVSTDWKDEGKEHSDAFVGPDDGLIVDSLASLLKPRVKMVEKPSEIIPESVKSESVVEEEIEEEKVFNEVIPEKVIEPVEQEEEIEINEPIVEEEEPKLEVKEEVVEEVKEEVVEEVKEEVVEEFKEEVVEEVKEEVVEEVKKLPTEEPIVEESAIEEKPQSKKDNLEEEKVANEYRTFLGRVEGLLEQMEREEDEIEKHIQEREYEEAKRPCEPVPQPPQLENKTPKTDTVAISGGRVEVKADKTEEGLLFEPNFVNLNTLNLQYDNVMNEHTQRKEASVMGWLSNEVTRRLTGDLKDEHDLDHLRALYAPVGIDIPEDRIEDATKDAILLNILEHIEKDGSTVEQEPEDVEEEKEEEIKAVSPMKLALAAKLKGIFKSRIPVSEREEEQIEEPESVVEEEEEEEEVKHTSPMKLAMTAKLKGIIKSRKDLPKEEEVVEEAEEEAEGQAIEGSGSQEEEEEEESGSIDEETQESEPNEAPVIMNETSIQTTPRHEFNTKPTSIIDSTTQTVPVKAISMQTEALPPSYKGVPDSDIIAAALGIEPSSRVPFSPVMHDYEYSSSECSSFGEFGLEDMRAVEKKLSSVDQQLMSLGIIPPSKSSVLLDPNVAANAALTPRSLDLSVGEVDGGYFNMLSGSFSEGEVALESMKGTDGNTLLSPGEFSAIPFAEQSLLTVSDGEIDAVAVQEKVEEVSIPSHLSKGEAIAAKYRQRGQSHRMLEKIIADERPVMKPLVSDGEVV